MTESYESEEKGDGKILNLNEYHPKNMEDVKHLSTQIPERVFLPDASINISLTYTPRGIFVVNIVHEDFPDTDVQAQICPSGDHFSNAIVDIFISQISPTENFLPNDFCESVATEIYENIVKQPQYQPLIHQTGNALN